MNLSKRYMSNAEVKLVDKRNVVQESTQKVIDDVKSKTPNAKNHVKGDLYDWYGLGIILCTTGGMVYGGYKLFDNINKNPQKYMYSYNNEDKYIDAVFNILGYGVGGFFVGVLLPLAPLVIPFIGIGNGLKYYATYKISQQKLETYEKNRNAFDRFLYLRDSFDDYEKNRWGFAEYMKERESFEQYLKHRTAFEKYLETINATNDKKN